LHNCRCTADCIEDMRSWAAFSISSFVLRESCIGFFNRDARTLSGYNDHVDKALSVKFVVNYSVVYGKS